VLEEFKAILDRIERRLRGREIGKALFEVSIVTVF